MFNFKVIARTHNWTTFVELGGHNSQNVLLKCFNLQFFDSYPPFKARTKQKI
jgi:hypothetical protein